MDIKELATFPTEKMIAKINALSLGDEAMAINSVRAFMSDKDKTGRERQCCILVIINFLFLDGADYEKWLEMGYEWQKTCLEEPL